MAIFRDNIWADEPEQHIGDPLNDDYVGNIENLILGRKPNK